MVDSIVSFAVQSLGDFLIETAARRLSFKDDVEWLKREFQYMQSFLKDAEAKQFKDHRVQQLISEITDLAFDTVDILERFIINVGSGEASEHGVVDRLKKYVCFCKKEANLYDISNEIESLRERVLDLSRKRATYDITGTNDAGEGPSNRSTVRVLRRTTSYAEEEHFVGFEDVTNLLLTQLLKNEDRRSVISIYGMGGLGKTTLARKLYNSIQVQNSFGCRAWVCVSQEYSIQDLLWTIIKSFKGSYTKEESEMLEKMNQEELERYLRDFLKEKRYVVVVDDVWHREAWESLKRALPDSHKGSRVIITTRKKDVAERVDDRNFVHQLRFLTLEESWNLFQKKISHGSGHAHWFSPAMQEMGKEMVEKCGGLPLAIIVLGGLLSNKKETEEWQKVKEQLWRHMKNDSIEISHLLSLSYTDLSNELKPCFLYIGIFPEDYVINAEKLMWLWMAEEFIPQGNMIEDIVEDYLYELINRSLIQVAERFWGRVVACRIHDLLRDLAVEKAMEINFFDIYDPRVYKGIPSGRRHAIHTQIGKYFSVGLPTKKLRSLVFFNRDSEAVHDRNFLNICQTFKYLCVLDLENARFGFSLYEPLPDSIGSLIHLKFLGLMHTKYMRLPRTIGNLRKLQVLEISVIDDIPCRLPMDISKLINLRHLYVHRSEGLLKVDTLTNLRTLKGVRYDQWMSIDTVNLVNLQELVLVTIEPLEGKTYSLNSISYLKQLRTLTLQSDRTLPPLEPLCSCPHLLRLWLEGKIEKLPSFNELPQSLTMLKLTESQLSEDPMPILEKMLNLTSLELDDAYDGKRITCSDNGFYHLEYLRLCHLTNLENWSLAETAMPVVRNLSIINCPNLMMVPERLKSIAFIAESEHNKIFHHRLPYPLTSN